MQIVQTLLDFEGGFQVSTCSEFVIYLFEYC